MNWRCWKLLKVVKRLAFVRSVAKTTKNMNNMKKRRESVATVYKRTTKFLSSNTANLLKKMPNTRKHHLLARVMEEYEHESDAKQARSKNQTDDEDDDLGERDLDYYLGVRTKEVYWRDPEGKEQVRKDFFINHCGISKEEYDKNYKHVNTKSKEYFSQPKLKQVPFKIHKKRNRRENTREDSWCEKSGIFKLFARRDSEYSTSDSYSEYESDDEGKVTTDNEDIERNDRDRNVDDITENYNYLTMYSNLNDILLLEGVRIKEVSDGRPCDNCPELCPGFIPHAWRESETLPTAECMLSLSATHYRIDKDKEQNPIPFMTDCEPGDIYENIRVQDIVRNFSTATDSL